MADVRIALRELLCKYKDDTEVDAPKECLVLLIQELMEAEVREKLGLGGTSERPLARGTETASLVVWKAERVP